MLPVEHPVNLLLEMCSLKSSKGRMIIRKQTIAFKIFQNRNFQTNLSQTQELFHGLKSCPLPWIVQQNPIELPKYINRLTIETIPGKSNGNRSEKLKDMRQEFIHTPSWTCSDRHRSSGCANDYCWSHQYGPALFNVNNFISQPAVEGKIK